MADHFPIGVNDWADTALIATPRLDGSEFARTCVYVFEHAPNVTQGLIVNAPLPNATLHEGFPGEFVDLLENRSVYRGGPTNPRAAFLLHSSEWSSANTRRVGEHYSITSDRWMLERMATQVEPVYWKMIIGCATWRPGQLEQEIDMGLWLPTAATDSIVFETNSLSQWSAAVQTHSSRVFDNYLA